MPRLAVIALLLFLQVAIRIGDDLLNGRGLLRTDLGRPIYFEVPKAYLFENVIVGARIALRLDDEGRAVRVMDTAIADVVITPDQPLAATAPEDP